MTANVAVRESRLGYRSLFSVDQGDEPDVIGAVTAQLHSWLRGKGYDVDAMRVGERSTIGPDVEGALYRIEDRDGSETLHATLTERRSEGEWGTKLTVHAPGRSAEQATVLLEISGPFKPGPPKIARLLTGALPARDSLSQLRDRPARVGVGDVDDLIDIVCDPDRRGLIFVSGMNAELPFDEWRQYVERLLRSSAGLAGAYFLDPAATERFRLAVGDSHRVDPGTVRTFLPEADPASELDAQRHRILTTRRIVKESSGRLANLLRDRARDEVLRAELPVKVRRLQRRIADHVDGLLVAPASRTDLLLEELLRASAPSAPPDVVEDVVSRVVESETPVAVSGHPQPATHPAETGPTRLAERALALAKAVLKTAEPSDEDWERIAAWTLVGQESEATQTRVKDQLSALRDDITDLQTEQAELRSQLLDEQLEHSDSLAELDALRRRNSYLEGQLRESDRAADVHGELPESHRDDIEDFEELLAFATDLEHVEITADEKVVLGLVEHDPQGEWARKVWDMLGALDDYALASADGRCDSDVDGYLRNTPDGCRGYSANKHASTESEAVRSSSRFSAARVFKVPTDVHGGGEVAMMAHFKIAQFGMVSPRMHYYDDTKRSGKIYVGYIGPHLPTKRTN